MKFLFIITVVLLAVQFCHCTEHPRGHLQPLGSHQPPEGDIEKIDVIPPPDVFYNKYIKRSKPVIFKDAAKALPGFSLWNDDYLRTEYGDNIVRVDFGKKENRARSADPMPLAEFLDIYKSSDRYLVDTLPEPMWKEFMLLPCITCGGFTKRLQDAVLWFSNGGTKSFLHMDTVDNIICMISGHKKWFYVDIKYIDHVDFDHKEGDYCAVDVDKVDMYRYPGLQDVPWWSADLAPGDCMYVPYGWSHQVTSISRNIAVNIWWTPIEQFNISDCQAAVDSGSLGAASLSHFNFTPAEQFRFMMIKLVENNSGQVNLEQIQNLLVSEHKGITMVDERIFSKFDVNKDGWITVDDLKVLPAEVFHEEFEDFEPGAINIFGQSRVKQVDVEELLASLGSRRQPPDVEEFLLREHKTKEDIKEFLSVKKGLLPQEITTFLEKKIPVLSSRDEL